MKIVRKKFLINPKLQLTTIFFNLGLALIAIAIFYFEHLYLFNKLTGLDSSELLSDPLVVELIQEEKAKMHILFAATSAGVALVILIGGLVLSNKVAGPIYRLNKHMNDICDGKTQGDVKFRKGDFFPEVAETFNRCRKFLKG